jgi:1,4-dihydroxy-2-naphthoyl-CoA hydrolase
MKTIWKRAATPATINARIGAGASGLFGIRVTAVREDGVDAEMAVAAHHLQPFGLLHGGVSVVLSETLGSLCSLMTLEPGKIAVGIEINANHLAAVRAGQTVTATCRALHVGRATQVWQTEIRRADGKLACVSRLTCAAVPGDIA